MKPAPVPMPDPYTLLFEKPRLDYDPRNRSRVRACWACRHRQSAAYGEWLTRDWHACGARGVRVFVVWEGF